MIDVGFKNFIDPKRVKLTIPNNSSRARWLIKESIAARKLINCTNGKKTESLIILNTGHLVLSSLKKSSLEKKIAKKS